MPLEVSLGTDLVSGSIKGSVLLDKRDFRCIDCEYFVGRTETILGTKSANKITRAVLRNLLDKTGTEFRRSFPDNTATERRDF